MENEMANKHSSYWGGCICPPYSFTRVCKIICVNHHRLFYTPLKIDFSIVEKLSFYIPIYDNTQFILQSPENVKTIGYLSLTIVKNSPQN